MPQKRVGWYLSISGVCAANSRRALEHVLKYALVAFMLRESPLPCVLRAMAISLLASLHCSVYHGARVFPHLLGFLGWVMVISFTTPACTACVNMYCSTAAALVSFVVVVSLIIFYKPSINSGSFV